MITFFFNLKRLSYRYKMVESQYHKTTINKLLATLRHVARRAIIYPANSVTKLQQLELGKYKIHSKMRAQFISDAAV